MVCSSRKYPYSLHGRVFLHPTSSQGNFSLSPYFAFKIVTFKTPSPLPLGISNDLPWGGYGFFLELHNSGAANVMAQSPRVLLVFAQGY